MTVIFDDQLEMMTGKQLLFQAAFPGNAAILVVKLTDQLNSDE